MAAPIILSNPPTACPYLSNLIGCRPNIDLILCGKTIKFALSGRNRTCTRFIKHQL